MVMLHPFPLSSRAFRFQLERPPPGVRFIAPDLRGFGRSPLVPGISTMEAMADDVIALMDSLGLPNAFIGGVSMGGYVALALTRLNPGRVRGLVLADTQSGADDEAGQQKREATAKDLEHRGMQALVETMLPKMFAPGVSTWLRDEVEALFRATAPAAAAAASRGMGTRTDAKDILPRFGGPVLALVGEHDAVTPKAKAQVIVALAKHAQLEVIPNAGHLAQLEQPDAFTTALQRFITGATGGAA
ncbi:MAG: alpha/beta fold hydrolase [Archangium sp.]|nr:alpha/beta fold hydrolase [Archangium sp.]